MSLHLHHPLRHITFKPVDPLGDGLREEILAEQNDPDHIDLNDRPSEDELVSYLQSITTSIQDETDTLTFSEN